MTETSPGGNALLRLWPDVRPYAGRIGLALGLILSSVVTSIAIPLVVKHVVDGPIARGDAHGLLWPVVIVSILGLVDSGAIWGRRRVGARPSAELETGMRAKVFAHAQRLAIGEHAHWDSGQLLSRGVEDLRQLRRFVAFFGPFFVVNTVAIVAVTVTLLVLCWPLGLVLIVCETPMLVTTSKIERAWNQVSRQVQDLVGDITTTVEESVLGVRVLKAFGAGDDSIAQYSAQADTLRALQLRETRLKASLWMVSGATPVLAVAAMLLASGWGVPEGQWTLGTLVAAISLVMYLNWPLTSIALLLGDLFNTMNAADRHWELMDRPISVADPDDPRELARPVRGELVFENVGFAHPDSKSPVLTDVSLRVEPGEIVALVGPTGSGKTTLANLVPRLLDATSGRITLDGVDIRELRLADLRAQIAVAFEEPVLFSASVRENVALGQPEATDEEIANALDVAAASDFVARLPWGTRTRIGEQGLSLSGGQRQRLALARAVLGQPKVLVLDDPLSALDVDTEALVQARLRAALSTAATLLVAHRPSTAALADRVALIWDGRIEAVGSHEDLLAASARYRHVMGAALEPSHV
ncbi:MAG: ABC transporter ATP-binding protein [Segniliparus sp.]|uniref:ABC transporter ATP-binding protein n=1 Tax=Segniliparus sp. TaxID=2804064 RepID=UPI003F2FA3DC